MDTNQTGLTDRQMGKEMDKGETNIPPTPIPHPQTTTTTNNNNIIVKCSSHLILLCQ